MSYKRNIFPPSSDVTYTAGDFSANGGMAWTVDALDVNGFRYQVSGKRMHLMVDLLTTSVTAPVANNFLQIKIPGGFLPRSTAQIPFVYQDNGGVPTNGYAILTMGSNIISLRPAAGANWTASVNLTRVSLNADFEVQ